MIGWRTLLLLSLLVVSYSGCGPPDEAQLPVRTVFQVEGMHCDGCSTSIASALEGVDGVVAASADHEAGTAEAVHRADTVTPEELEPVIEDLGYGVVSWRSESAAATP